MMQQIPEANPIQMTSQVQHMSHPQPNYPNTQQPMFQLIQPNNQLTAAPQVQVQVQVCVQY